jgi:hypothetical protein
MLMQAVKLARAIRGQWSASAWTLLSIILDTLINDTLHNIGFAETNASIPSSAISFIDMNSSRVSEWQCNAKALSALSVTVHISFRTRVESFDSWTA